jgi:hypothetical protein
MYTYIYIYNIWCTEIIDVVYLVMNHVETHLCGAFQWGAFTGNGPLPVVEGLGGQVENGLDSMKTDH